MEVTYVLHVFFLALRNSLNKARPYHENALARTTLAMFEICPLRFTFLDTLSLESSKVFGAYIDRLRRVGRYKLISDFVAVLVAHGQALHLQRLELRADIAFN